MTLPKFATPRIFAQITLLIPTGEIHMIALTIFMMTSSMILKKSMTSLAFFPRDPRTVPNVRQKKMMPKVFVPDLRNSCFNPIYNLEVVEALLKIFMVRSEIYT